MMAVETNHQGLQIASSVNISTKHISQIRRRVLRWGRTNYRHFPWREPEKSWHGLVAEVLLQRTRAKNAINVYKKFTRTFPDAIDLASAPVSKIEEIIYPLGLRWRAPLLKQLGEALDSLGGEPPATLEQLLKLPGVGAYAAAAWLSFHGNGRGVIIDANVVRWICRLVDRKCDAETRRKKWLIKLANDLTPERGSREFNYAILDFTMEICTTRPRCERCPIGPEFCAYGRKILLKEYEQSDSSN
jgi:A/G-specific adenine glycosylase